jgi:hypothetical protein
MTNALVLAQELLACLQTQLTAPATAYPIAPQYVMLRAGEQVTPLLGTNDDECCRGLGWVRISTLTGVRELGTLDNVSCFRQERRLTLELGVVRCAPSSPVGSVPTEDQWTLAATQLDSDMGSMEAAICCAFGDIEGSAAEEVAVGEYRPVGVDGNCIGGTMLVHIMMSACCPTEE